ncbi:hypothetical protein ABTO78_13715 [Acinetobacter baumannii]
MDKFEEELKEILAQSKHKSSGAERFVRASLAENKYPKDFLVYFINSECFGDYESELPAYEAWQHQQAKVEELEKQLSEYIFVSETLDEMYLKEVKSSEELQEEFAEDERFLKEQIKDKDLKISNLEYQQGMDKELIRSLQSKIEKLQKRVGAAKQLIEDLNKCYQQDHQNKFEYWRGFADSAGILGKRLEQALKGEKE